MLELYTFIIKKNGIETNIRFISLILIKQTS